MRYARIHFVHLLKELILSAHGEIVVLASLRDRASGSRQSSSQGWRVSDHCVWYSPTQYQHTRGVGGSHALKAPSTAPVVALVRTGSLL